MTSIKSVRASDATESGSIATASSTCPRVASNVRRVVRIDLTVLRIGRILGQSLLLFRDLNDNIPDDVKSNFRITAHAHLQLLIALANHVAPLL